MLSFKQFSFPPAAQQSTKPFNPSDPTKRFWLYTKKNELSFGITLPGLCETVDYSTQMLAFFGILVLEIVPTVYGISQGLLWQAVAAAILVDIFLAIVAHIWHDETLLSKNKLIITNDPITIANLKRKITKYKSYSNIFYFLIFLSGCIKFVFFYIAYIYIDAISIAVLVCYLLAAILHIFYTGYFIYTSRFYWFINKEYKEYLNTNGNNLSIANINSQPIIVDGADVQFNEFTIGLHKISKRDDRYYFETLGIMTDQELASFIRAQQSPIARSVIAREGLAHQLLILNL